MTLLWLVLQVVCVVFALHALCLYTVAGVGDLREAVRTARENVRGVAPTAALLTGVLAMNGVIRDVGVELSWLVGVNITEDIHAVEGEFVAAVQSLATPPLTAYFSFVYVFGYVFLLTFPLVVYAIHDDTRPLRTTIVAYTLNYVLGLLCYVVFVAYGPRNFMPDLVNSLLFANWPQSRLLTRQVNVNTNVFPSLHTSLAATVAILSLQFRDVSGRWVPVATVLATSVVVSTMYLGIHWLTDVVAGGILAVVSVVVATRVVRDRRPYDAPIEAGGLGRDVLDRLRRFQ